MLQRMICLSQLVSEYNTKTHREINTQNVKSKQIFHGQIKFLWRRHSTKLNYCEIIARVDHEMKSQLVNKINRLCTWIALYKHKAKLQ